MNFWQTWTFPPPCEGVHLSICSCSSCMICGLAIKACTHSSLGEGRGGASAGGATAESQFPRLSGEGRAAVRRQSAGHGPQPGQRAVRPDVQVPPHPRPPRSPASPTMQLSSSFARPSDRMVYPLTFCRQDRCKLTTLASHFSQSPEEFNKNKNKNQQVTNDNNDEILME